jgi:hypothetical protein
MTAAEYTFDAEAAAEVRVGLENLYWAPDSDAKTVQAFFLKELNDLEPKQPMLVAFDAPEPRRNDLIAVVLTGAQFFGVRVLGGSNERFVAAFETAEALDVAAELVDDGSDDALLFTKSAAAMVIKKLALASEFVQ